MYLSHWLLYTEDNCCISVPVSLYPLSAHLSEWTFSLEWLHCSVSLTEDQAQLRQPHSLHHTYNKQLCHKLPDEYWDSLGPNGLFLHEPFHN